MSEVKGGIFGRIISKLKSPGSPTAEVKKPSYEQSIAEIKERVGQDGHLLENALSLIAHQTAAVRNLFPSIPDASFALMDAMAGDKKTIIPQAVVNNLLTLATIIDNNPLIGDAQHVGIGSSPNTRKALDEAFKTGLPELRAVALKLHVPNRPGEQSMTLGARIQAVSPQK